VFHNAITIVIALDREASNEIDWWHSVAVMQQEQLTELDIMEERV
jgi:hypothetical protein